MNTTQTITHMRPSLLAATLPAMLFLLVLLAVPSAYAQRGGTTGLGGQVGEPSGLTLKLYNPGAVSYDFLAAWDLDDFFFLNVHGLYERPLGNERNLRFFYGPGVFVGFRDRPREDDDDVVVGISGSLGLSFWVDRFEVYGQITPRLSVLPDTDGDVGGGLGIRFYF